MTILNSHPPAHDIVTFGETMAMLVAGETGPLSHVTHFTKRIAGADSNVAIGLARLGLEVAWISRVGNDSLGRFITDTLIGEGIDCSRVLIDDEYPTGFQFKSRRDDGGDPEVEYFRRGSAASRLAPHDLPRALLQSARHLHCTGIPPALSDATLALTRHAMSTMRELGGTVSFDPNLRPALWPDTATMQAEINALAAMADWVMPGLEEGRILTGLDTAEAIADFYLERGAREVVIKLGADGAWWQNRDSSLHCPAQSVSRIVDTVGAGDGFAAGFISARLEGLSPRDCLERANFIGACALGVAGDMEGLPRRDELDVGTHTARTSF
ncbi:sugar kinase [Kushneria phosphatilytica]|uniref:Sugar kinase n=1 Tax=Kushneria phosphatilytica TaxID=657387 RepID=A0A1S1P1E5_9GAMM|nr:sugar kinase [Kushneria phosphatilytica]OHV12305.1 2-dehydro-3-deoxygluconokinase [Kushneria phosphatilytica]QEL11511.1 sugar kinase [Kushneria phosphatilytica]